jgi:hypothetical protein
MVGHDGEPRNVADASDASRLPRGYPYPGRVNLRYKRSANGFLTFWLRSLKGQGFGRGCSPTDQRPMISTP